MEKGGKSYDKPGPSALFREHEPIFRANRKEVQAVVQFTGRGKIAPFSGTLPYKYTKRFSPSNDPERYPSGADPAPFVYE